MKLKKYLTTILLSLLTTAITHAAADIDETLIEETIVVDQEGAGDFTTFAAAMEYLNAHPNKAIKVLVKPGVYREDYVKVEHRPAAATIIEGTEAGEVIFSGADIWTDWTEEGNGLYSKEWLFNWGEAKYDSNYHIKNDLGRRCEIVLWDSERMTQVASLEEVQDGHFFVDEESDKLWLKPPTDKAIDDGTIEVAVRTQGFWFRSVNNLVLRNLKIVNKASGSQHALERFTVAIFGNDASLPMRDLHNMTDGILIDNCEFSGNNASGLTLANYRYVSIINSRFNDNGTAGAGPSRLRYMEVVGCEFNSNNWRVGGYGKFYDWAPAGVKFFESSDFVIRDCEFNDNLAPGLWLDWQHENCVVDNIVANNNAGPGIYIEGSIGPFLVTNSEFINNSKLAYHGANHGGVLIAESQNVTITNCVIKDNSHSAVMIRTRPRADCGGYFSGKRFGGTVLNVTLTNNIMRGMTHLPVEDVRAEWYSSSERVTGGLIMNASFGNEPMYRSDFLTSLWADNNTYYHPDTEVVFSNGGDYGFERIALQEWQEQYGLDTNSIWLD